MKVAAVIQADLIETPLGTRSRLADELAGAPVLRRTVERISRSADPKEPFRMERRVTGFKGGLQSRR